MQEGVLAGVVVVAILAGLFTVLIWCCRQPLRTLFGRRGDQKRCGANDEESSRSSKEVAPAATSDVHNAADKTMTATHEQQPVQQTQPSAPHTPSASTIRAVTPDSTPTHPAKRTTAPALPEPKLYTPSHYRLDPPGSISHHTSTFIPPPLPLFQTYSAATFPASPQLAHTPPRAHRPTSSSRPDPASPSTVYSTSPSRSNVTVTATYTPSVYRHEDAEPPESVARSADGRAPPSLPQDYSVATFVARGEVPPWAYLSAEEVT